MHAFVLRRNNLRENDQVITFYTFEKGKVEALARGIKKITSKNSSYLSPVFLVEAEVVEGREFFQLTKVVPLVCYKNILEDLDKSVILQTAFSWLDTLTHLERDTKIFLLVKKWIEFLNGDKNVNTALAYSFLANLLKCLGFSPELNQCTVCDKKNSLEGFYPAGGGLVCHDCLLLKKQAGEQAYSLRSADILALKLLFTSEWNKIFENHTEIANRLVFLYGQYHSGKKLTKLPKII